MKKKVYSQPCVEALQVVAATVLLGSPGAGLGIGGNMSEYEGGD